MAVTAGVASAPAATYVWNGGTASWASPSSWTPNRTTPANDDLLVFDGGGATTATNVPTQAVGRFVVSQGTSVELTTGSANSLLTIRGGSGDDLVVAAGSALNVAGGNALKLFVGSGATASIGGDMTFSGAPHTLDAADAGAVTFANGAVFTQAAGCTGNVFTAAGTPGSVVFAAGAVFVSQAGSHPFGLGQPASKVVFQTGSRYRHEQTGTPSFSGRTYADFELNVAGSISVSGGVATSVDDLTVTQGALTAGMLSAFHLRGDVSVAAGQSLSFSPSLAATLSFDGTAPQSVGGEGRLTFSANQNVAFANAAGTTLASPLTLRRNTTVEAGAMLALAAPLTNSGTLSVQGTLRVLDGGAAAGADFGYGAASRLEYMIAGAPYAVAGGAEWPASGGPGDVAVAGAGGITLGVARAVPDTFRVAGPVAGGGQLTLAGRVLLESGGSFVGAPVYGPASTLEYRAGGVQVRGDEWGVATSQPGYPANVRVTNGTSLDYPGGATAGRAISGDLVIDAGSALRMDHGAPSPPVTGALAVAGDVVLAGTLALGNGEGGDLVLGGDWTGAGTLVANHRTVRFAGASPQAIAGANAFDGLEIANPAGAALGGDATVADTLRFVAGRITTGAHTLTLGDSGVVVGAGAGGYVAGRLRKPVAIAAGTGSQTLEVGDSTTYAPVEIVWPGTATAGGAVTASTGAGDHPDLGGSGLDPDRGVARYWTLSDVTVAFDTFDATFHFDATELDAGADTSAFAGARRTAGAWHPVTVAAAGATSATVTGATAAGEFAMAEPRRYVIAASAGAGGAVAPSGDVVVRHGDDVTFAITPDSCHTVEDVLVDGVSQGPVASYAFENVVADHTIAAGFAPRVFTITTVAGAGAVVEPAGPVVVTCGGDLAFAISVDGCHALDTLLVDGVPVPADTSYTFANVQQDHQLEVRTSRRTRTILASAGAGGAIAPAGMIPVACGDPATFTITPDSCWTVADVVVDGVSQGAVAAYTFTDVRDDHVISASFARVVHTITADAGPGGVIAPAGAVGVECGSDQAFTIVPDPHYSIADVVVDGLPVGPVAAYTFTNVTAPHSISASFSLPSYTLAVDFSGSGSVVRNPDLTTYPYGTVVQLTATAAAGWHFAGWSGDTSGMTNPLALVMTGNRAVSAVFLENRYTWLPVGSGAWDVPANWAPERLMPSPDDVLMFEHGATTTATAVPAQTVGRLVVSNGTDLTLVPAAAATLTVAGGDGPDFEVRSGSRLRLTAATALQISLAAGATGAVAGEVQVSGAAHRILCATAGGLVFGPGSSCLQQSGFTGNLFGTTSLQSVIFQAGSLFSQAAGSNPFGAAAPNAVAVFQTGSRFRLDGNVTPALSGRTYADFEHNTPGPTSTTGGSPVQMDHLIVTQGVWNSGMTGGFTVRGDVTVQAGAVLHFQPPAGSAVVTLAGAAPQTLASHGTISSSSAQQLEIANPAGVALATDLVWAGGIQFTSGRIVTGENTLQLGLGSPVTGASQGTGWVDGRMRRAIASAAARRFEVGDATTFAPVSVTIRGLAAACSLVVATRAPDHPALGSSSRDPLRGANRWWSVAPVGAPVFTDFDAVFGFGPGDLDAGADPLAFDVERYAGGAWTLLTPGARTDSSTQAIGVTGFGEFATGQPITAHVIVATAGIGGAVVPAGAVTVPHGGDTTFTFLPDPCHAVADVRVDGVSVGAVPSYSFTSVAADHTIEALFEPRTFTITATAQPGATIEPSGPVAVGCGGALSFVIAPASDCDTVTALIVDGVPQPPASSWEFLDVQADHTLEVVVARKLWRISATSGIGGGLSPYGDVDVECGADALFAINRGPGYDIADVAVDGVSVGPVEFYTFADVRAPHTIYATFRDTMPPVVAVTWPNGGENLDAGYPTTLTWVAADNSWTPPTVDLYVSRNLGADWEPIALGVPNTGSYGWMVMSPGTNSGSDTLYTALFRVVTQDAVPLTGRDESDAPFSIFQVTVDVAAGRPAVLELGEIRPNPSPAAVRIDFSLAEAGTADLHVVDVQGRVVAELARGPRSAGRHRAVWDGRGSGRPVPGGVYFVRLCAGGRTFTKRMVVIP